MDDHGGRERSDRTEVAAVERIGAGQLCANQSAPTRRELAALLFAQPPAQSPFYFDLHIDTPARIISEELKLDESHPYTCVDIPKMRQGGLHAGFFAILASARSMTPAEAYKRALQITKTVVDEVKRHRRDLVLATSTREVLKAKRDGKIAILLAIEGGHMIDSNLDNLRHFYKLGARYMGLTHSGNTPWVGAAEYLDGPKGLTDFGREVVREMNRLGMMIDLAHASDQAFYDTLAVTKAPIINTHAACRKLANHPRNLTDDMLKALAKNGGVLGVAYYTGMLDDAHREKFREVAELGRKRGEIVKQFGADKKRMSEELWKVGREEVKSIGQPPLSRLVDHIEHAATVAGIDHVGLGCDFDSIGPKTPANLDHIGQTPNLIAEMTKRGFKPADIAKIMGGNALRVMQQAEK